MPTIISSVEQATPAWLTQTLREAQVLGHGEVIAVTRGGNPAFNSAVAHLELAYSGDAPAAAPRHLVLKCSLGDAWAVAAGAREVAFYTLVAALRAPLPMVPTCYAAAFSEEERAPFLLLQDYSHTHHPPVTRDQILSGQSVPSTEHVDQVVEALAQFHAYWWEHPRLGSGVVGVGTWCRDAAHYERYVRQREAEWASFIRDEGAWFPAGARVVCEQALALLPRLWEHYLERRVATLAGLALSHGDTYFSNFLCPPAGVVDATYLIDYQSVSADVGAGDLVNLMATFWTPEQRQEHGREERVLRHYHQTLQAHGVKNYTWDDLLNDYRLMVIVWIFVAIWDQNNGSGKDYWWPKLQCLIGAFEDLHCADLLSA